MSGREHTSAPASRIIPFLLTAIILLAASTWAQNNVPPSARQAANMPAFASRLAHHPQPRPSNPVRHGPPQRPMQDQIAYENGPINGTTDAWTINFGYAVADTFTISTDPYTIDHMDFGAWLAPGDTLISAEVSITSDPFGGTSYFDGTVQFSQGNCSTNEYGYNVCTETSSMFSGPALQPGTYWVTLQNAVVNTGDPVYWDENSGVGCGSSGCPSLADENQLGTLPSEAFTILGEASTTQPPPQCFGSDDVVQVIHDFTAEEGGTYGANGVVLDGAGNLYGTTATGGDNSAGLAFKQYRGGDGWIFDPLYSFLGGANGTEPNGVMVGPHGALYGGSSGGIENCGYAGQQYCGMAYKLTPFPNACLTALCRWMEWAPYQFAGGNDAWGQINVTTFDHEGNLYGISEDGGGTGCNGWGCGVVFKLSPSPGGWTETILYTFTGADDGSAPTEVLMGPDGNLYGVAGGGLYGDGVVFQLTPSGNGWSESVLHSFQYQTDGTNPQYLMQDSAGNLYGITQWFDVGPIFTLQPSPGGWQFNEYLVTYNYGDFIVLVNLTIDSAGNLYGTGFGGQGCQGSGCKGKSGPASYSYEFIFKASYGIDGWQYTTLDSMGTEFPSGGSMAVDAQGNLYGTTSGCGQYGHGTIWEVSP